MDETLQILGNICSLGIALFALSGIVEGLRENGREAFHDDWKYSILAVAVLSVCVFAAISSIVDALCIADVL